MTSLGLALPRANLLSTNAQFVRWDQLEDVLSRRLLNRLVVSCDGDGTPDSYERLRPPAKWQKLEAFLAGARDLRDRYCPSMELMTRTVIKDPDDMSRWKGFLEPLGWRPEFRRWINLVGASEDLSQRDWRPGEGLCHFTGPSLQLYVDWNGTVVPCCAHPRAANLGDLSVQRWSEIHSGEKRLAFVGTLQNDRGSLDICGKCEFGTQTDLGQYMVPGQQYS